MRKIRHHKTISAILIVLLGSATATLSACGQRGPLKLPERSASAEPTSATQTLPPESPTK